MLLLAVREENDKARMNLLMAVLHIPVCIF